MSDQTVSFSVLLVVAPGGDRLAISERVAAVLGYDVDWVMSALNGPEVRLLETQDEREALRVTAALRMRELDVRSVHSQQWQTAIRSAGARGIQLSDMVMHTVRPSNGGVAAVPSHEVATSADSIRAVSVPVVQVPLPVEPRAQIAETRESVQSAGASVLRQRTTAGGLAAITQPQSVSERGSATTSQCGTDDASPGQGAAVFRLARRPTVTGEAMHSNDPHDESTLQVPIAPSASQLAGDRATLPELQEPDATPSAATLNTGGSLSSTALTAASDRVHTFEQVAPIVSSPAVPVKSSSAERRRTSGGARTIDFELEASRLAGAEVQRGEDEEDEQQAFAGTPRYSDSTSGNFGSFEDELASVSALHEGDGGSGQWSRAAAVTKRTTVTSNPDPARAVPRKEAPASAGKSGGGWLPLVTVTVLLGLGLGGLAMWVNEQRSNVVAQFAAAGFYAEFTEIDRRYGCGRLEDGSQLCRANDAWYAYHFPGLRPYDAQLASDTCYFRRTDAGTSFTAQLQCTIPGSEGGEPAVYLNQSQRRECEPALDSLLENQESTCRWNEESSMHREREARPAPTSSTDTWQVRFLAERESFPTLGGAVTAREYRVTPSAGPEFVWSWSPDVAATVRETPVGGLPRMQMSGRIWPSGRLGDATLR